MGLHQPARRVANRVYLGEVRSADHVKANTHPPLTDAVTWQRAQAPRELTPRANSQPSLLAGLVRCAGCGMAMSGSVRRSGDGTLRHNCVDRRRAARTSRRRPRL
jgi:hypothetical protein